MMDPYQVLGLDSNEVTDEAVRQAYLQAIRDNPPEKAPEEFARIQTAYDMINKESKRIQLELFGLEHESHLPEETTATPSRPRAGAKKWLDMIDEESRRMAPPNPYSGQKKNV